MRRLSWPEGPLDRIDPLRRPTDSRAETTRAVSRAGALSSPLDVDLGRNATECPARPECLALLRPGSKGQNSGKS